MTILSYNELCDLVDRGVVENVEPWQIQGSSIDLTLGDTFMIEGKGNETVTKDNPLPLIKIGNVRSYTLDPNEFILAHTEQIFNMPDDLCAIFYLNSSDGRNALQHMLATFCDPNWHGSALTLELQNATKRHSIRLEKGMRIGQVVFHKLSSPVPHDMSYAVRGRYNNDKSVMGVKSK